MTPARKQLAWLTVMLVFGALAVIALTRVGPSEAAHHQRVYEQALLGYTVTPKGLSAQAWYVIAAVSGGVSVVAAVISGLVE